MFGFKTKEPVQYIQKAVETLIPVPCIPENIEQELADVRQQRAALVDSQAKLLPIEMNFALPDYEERIIALREREHRLVTHKSFPYPRLSLEVLKWRNKQKLPQLVLFSPFQKEVAFETTLSGRNNRRVSVQTHPAYPSFIEEYYEDVFNRLKRQSLLYSQEIKWTATWAGIIPDNVRQIIEEKKNSMMLFLLAEPSQWTKTTANVPRLKSFDPLLLACDQGDLYVLNQFDVTPLEHYAVSEFTHQ